MSKATILAALEKLGPSTTKELMLYLGIGQPAVTTAMGYLRGRELGGGEIRVREWQRTVGRGGRYTPVYELSSEPDAPYPPKIPRKLVSRAYDARNRAKIAVRRYGARSRYANPFYGLIRAAS